MDRPRQDEAHELLAEAGAARERLTGRGRPVRRYLLAFAVAALVVFPLAGLTDGPANLIVVLAFLGVCGLLDWWVRGQPVTEKGGDRRRVWGSIAWVLIYLAALVIGNRNFSGEPAYWILVSIVVAAPLFLAALLPTRR